MDAFRYIAYQTYSLSGDSPGSTARMRVFGTKTIKDNLDGDDETDGRRTFSKSGEALGQKLLGRKL